jgi:hypothetical protein
MRYAINSLFGHHLGLELLRCRIEHRMDGCDTGNILRTESLVECRCSTFEHRIHGCDARNIPCTEVFVICRCRIEHLCHCCNTGDISTKGIIKSSETIEHILHISYFTYIPACDIAAIEEGALEISFGH